MSCSPPDFSTFVVIDLQCASKHGTRLASQMNGPFNLSGQHRELAPTTYGFATDRAYNKNLSALRHLKKKYKEKAQKRPSGQTKRELAEDGQAVVAEDEAKENKA